VGPCDVPKPSFFDRKGRAKWSAWADLGQLPGGEAQQRYVDLLSQLIPGWTAGSSSSSGGGGAKRGGAGGPVQSRMVEAAEDEQAAVRSRHKRGTAAAPGCAQHAAVCLCKLPRPLTQHGAS